MRNLKRVLSLALACVMVIGMMVMTTGAADFTDTDEITYTEAVDVLSTLNVINGRDDGSFDPTGSVTRAEMAKMICIVHNGGKDPLLGAEIDAMFTDTVGHWAKAYIAYASNLGIISGMGDGTFAPDAQVTGTQAAKMLLVTLGYDPDVFYLTGAGWDTTTEVIANGIDMFEGLEGTNLSAALTREKAAQMIYNALNAKIMVKGYNEVLSNGQISYSYDLSPYKTLLNDTYGVWRVEGVVVANEYADITSKDSKTAEGKTVIAAISNSDEVQGNVTGTTYNVSTGADELGKTVVMFVKPSVTSPSSVRATVLGEAIIADHNTVLETYGKKMGPGWSNWLKGAGLQADTNTKYVTDYDLSAVYDDVTDDRWEDLAGNAAATISGNNSGVKATVIDNNGDGKVDYIMAQNKTLTKITVVNDDKEYISLNAAVDGKTTIEYDDLVAYEGIAKDDIAMVYTAGGVWYIEKPATAYGTISTYGGKAGDNEYAVIDGTTYHASSLTNDTGLNSLAATMTNVKESGVFYLDDGKNVIAADLTAAVTPDNVCYVESMNATNSYNTAYDAFVFLPDGSKGVYDIASYNGSYKASDISGVTAGLYVYSMTDKGIALRDYQAVNLNAQQFSQVTTAVSLNLDGDVANYTASMAVNGAAAASTTIYMNDETKFFLHDTDVASRTAPGYISVVTGYQNLDDTAVAYANSVVAFKVVNGVNVALAVYGESATVNVAASADLIFLPNTEWVKNGDNYDVKALFVGDTETTPITMDTVPAVGVYEYTKNSAGIYSLNEITYASDNGYTGNLLNVTDSLLYVDGTQLNNLGGAKVFDAINGKPVEVSASFIADNTYGYAVVDNTNDNNVLAVYVVGKYEIMATGVTIASGLGTAANPFVLTDTSKAVNAMVAASDVNVKVTTYTSAAYAKPGSTEYAYDSATSVATGTYFTVGGKNVDGVGISTVYYQMG